MQAVTAAREEPTMSKFKIEHGASRVNLVLLKTNIEDTISQDIDLLATWSDNDRKYLVNELLRFALTQEEDFQKYKASLAMSASRPTGNTRATSAQAKPAADSTFKSEPLVSSTTTHA
jgi:hypothetical protein